MKRNVQFRFILAIGILSVVFCLPRSSPAQSNYFSFRIDSMLVHEIWDQYMDDCGSGQRSKGNDTNYYSFSTDYKFDNIVNEGPQALISNHSDTSYQLTIAYDRRSKIFRSISFRYGYQSGYQGYGGDYQSERVEFSIQNVPFQETSDYLDIELSGSALKQCVSNFSRDYSLVHPYQHVYSTVRSLPTTNNKMSFTFWISKQDILGVPSNSDIHQSVYPNPASNELHISLPQNIHISSVAVTDFLGRELKRNSVAANTTDILLNIADLTQGIYYLRAGNQMQKFVIQR